MENQIKPYGLRMLRVLAVLSLILEVYIIYKLPTTFSNLSYGMLVWNIAYSLLSIAIPIIAIIAINKRNSQLYKIVFLLFVVDVVVTMLTMFSSFSTSIDKILTTIIGILPLMFILWYLNKVKSYFTSQAFNADDPIIKKADSKVNMFIIIWIILLIIVTFSIRFLSYKGKLQTITEYVKVFKDKTIQENMSYCNSFEAEKKDDCLLTFASFVISKNEPVDENICASVSQEDIRVGCYALINKCELVSDQNIKAACDIQAQNLKQKREDRAKDNINK